MAVIWFHISVIDLHSRMSKVILVWKHLKAPWVPTVAECCGVGIQLIDVLYEDTRLEDFIFSHIKALAQWSSSIGSKPLMVRVSFSFFSSTFKARSLQLSFRWGNNECVNSDTSTHSSTMYIVRLCHQINETMTFGQSGIMRDNETHMAHPHTHTDYIYHWPQAVGPSCSLPALCPSHNVTSTRLTAANRVQHCCLPRLAQSLCAPPWS